MNRIHEIVGLLALGAAVSCSREVATADPAMPPGAIRLARINGELRNTPVLSEINRVEDEVLRVERDVLRPWTAAWRRADARALAAIGTADAVMPDWSAARRTMVRSHDGITESRIAAPSVRGDHNAAYLAQFSRVADAMIRVDRAAFEGEVGRLHVRFDLRGETPGGGRRHDRGALQVEVRRTAGAWRLTRVAVDGEFDTVESAPGRRPAFEDRTEASGLAAVPVVPRREAIRRGGYALAAEDLDGDGNTDLLVGHADSAQLWRGVGGGRFVDSTAAAGLGGVTLVKSAAIADLDRDGRRDLLLVRFVDSPETTAASPEDDPLNGRPGDGEVLGFANRGGRFERVQRVLQRGHRYARAMPLSVADFDADGALDLYLGFPGVRDFTNSLRIGNARDGFMRQGLWRNRGGWNFAESAMGGAMRSDDQRFPHASLATDLDGDGRPELVVIDDSGAPNVVYRNDGQAFHESSEAMKLDTPGWGMGAASGDFDGDGDIDLAMSSIAMAAAERILTQAEALPLDAQGRAAIAYQRAGNRGLRLFRNDGRGRFEEVTDRAGVANVGEAPAGIEWVDYNHDGWLDLYVANGLWTGDQDGDDVTSIFFRMAIARDLARTAHHDSAASAPGDADPNPLLTVLREFRGRVGETTTYVANGPSLSLAGGEHHRLLRNNGDGTFTDVSYIENADRSEDGYVIAPADLDGDGRVDLALRNCDPAPGRRFPVVVFLRNTRTSDHALRVILRGNRDNPDGVGARISVRVGGRLLVREVRSANGAAQGEAAVSFGLGDAHAVEGVEVRWPSGLVQTLGPSPEGRLVVAQPD